MDLMYILVLMVIVAGVIYHITRQRKREREIEETMRRTADEFHALVDSYEAASRVRKEKAPRQSASQPDLQVTHRAKDREETTRIYLDDRAQPHAFIDIGSSFLVTTGIDLPLVAYGGVLEPSLPDYGGGSSGGAGATDSWTAPDPSPSPDPPSYGYDSSASCGYDSGGGSYDSGGGSYDSGGGGSE